MTLNKADRLYWSNATWVESTKLFDLSLARLFVLIDKYSIAKLHDDINAALMGHCWALDWFPDPNKEMVAVMFDNLPGSSNMIKSFVHCTALIWTHGAGSGLHSQHAVFEGHAL